MTTETATSDLPAIRRALLLFAETTLRPIIRILLRHGIAYAEFNQIARKVYVDVAMQEPEFRLPGKKRQSKSRCACITGLSRKEVLRLDERERPADDPELPSSNRAARVLEGWISDASYLDGDGKPLSLPFRAPSGRRSFSSLVHEYSGDITPRAVLHELVRAGSCVAWGDDDIRVRKPEYIAHPVDMDALTAGAMQAAARLAKIDAMLLGEAQATARERSGTAVAAAY